MNTGLPNHVPNADDRAFESLAIGDVFEVERTFSCDDVLAFARVSGDHSPLHVDPDYARTTEFGDCVVHGILLASLFSQLVGMRVPGRPALYLGQDLVFRRPVLVSESVRAIARVVGKNDATRTLLLNTEVRGRDDKISVSGSAKVKVRGLAAQATNAPTTHASSVASDPRKVALVTGGSRGIGAAIARELAARGMAVAVNYYKSADHAAAVVADIERTNGLALAVQGDVRDEASVATLLEICACEIGEPTVLVNAATAELTIRDAIELSWDDFATHLDYQAKAVLRLCQSVHPMMKRRGGGAIVNVASQVTGGVPPSGMADYVTAKYALEGLSKALAAEWAGDSIRVNIVSPSITRTELTQFHHERVFRAEALRTPLRRLATPEDIARAVAYLASDDGAFLTGTNLFVTGGQVML